MNDEKESILKLQEEIAQLRNENKLLRLSLNCQDDSSAKVQKTTDLTNLNSIYQNLVSKMVQGFALHKIVLDEDEKPIDYVFLDVNERFEKLTGLNAKDIIGKTVKEVIPNIEDYWIEIYGNVALSGESIQFEHFAAPLNKYYEVVAFSPQKYLFATIFTDTTFKKNLEKEIRKSSETFKTIADYTANWEVLFDNNGKILWTNKLVKEITGYSADEILEEKNIITKLIYNKDITKVARTFREILRGEKVKGEDFEFRCIKKDGTIFWLSVNWQKVFNNEGKIIGLRTSSRDVTDKKKTYELVNILSKTVEHSPVSIFITDTNGSIIYSNEKFTEITGYTKDEIIGKNPRILNSGYHNYDYFTKIWNTIKSGEEWTGEVRNKKKNGDLFWEKEYIFPIYNQSGEIANFVAIFEDIEEVKRVNKKIMMLVDALNNLKTYVFIKNTERQYIYANKVMLELLNENDTSIIGKKDSDFYDELTCNMIEFHDNLAVNSLATTKNEEYIVFKNNNAVFVETIRTPQYDEQGNVIGLYCIANDITERKRFENELLLLNEQLEASRSQLEVDLYKEHLLIEQIEETKKALEKTNSEKDKFFSIIAHDLKNPFNAFLGLTKMMSENINDFELDDITEISKQLYESASNLYKLLENLLEWSRIQRGVTQFNPEYVELDFLVKQNFEIVKEFANQKEIALERNIPDKCEVFCDVPMINTVLRNLISNSIKFTPRKGTVTISATQNDTETIISISDTGIGMNQELMSKLFKIDEKVSRNGTEGEQSTGLGLLLCKEFVEKHNGKIWVESEEGKGSSFIFSLPNMQNNTNN